MVSSRTAKENLVMSERSLSTDVRHLRTLLGAPPVAEPTDRQLLQEFVLHGAEAPFETLVRRHGPMVQRLARRLLLDWHEAEDVFQATFLLLARRAVSLTRRDSVAGWLHEVAYRTALNTRANAARRRRRERQSGERRRNGPLTETDRLELRDMLDAELLRLPEKYRVPLVLCYLEGKTNEEAARQLRWPTGTVKGRLARARDLLRSRLARRGFAPATATLAALMAENPASAALLESLVPSTVRAVVAFRAGQGASAGVEALVRGTLSALTTVRLKVVALVLLLTSVLALGVGWAAQQSSTIPQQNVPRGIQPQSEAGDKKPAVLFDRHGDALPPGALFRLGTTRLRHGDIVRAVAFSPDDKVVASASDDGTVRLWEPRSGKELRQFNLTIYFTNSIVFSPDGKRLACGNYRIGLFDPVTGTQLVPPKEAEGMAESLCFSPDGSVLAWGSRRTFSIHLWDANTLRPLRKLSGHEDRVQSVAFSPDGRFLASASSDGTVRLWQVRTGKEIRQFSLAAAQAVAFSPDGKTVAAGGQELEIKLWDVASGKLQRSLRGHNNWVTGLAFSRDGKSLAASGGDSTVRLWEVATGKQLWKSEGHQGWVLTVAFSGDGKALASGGADHTVRVWEASSGKELHPFGELGAVESVVFSPDGKTLAAGDDEEAIRLWDTATGKQVRKLTEREMAVKVIGKQSKQKRGQHHVRTLSYSPDGKTLASAGGDGVVRLWDLPSGKPQRRLLAPRAWVNTLAFSPDGKTLASADYSSAAVNVWDLATGQSVRQLQVHEYQIAAVAFSPDGKTLATGEAGPRGRYPIRLWDTATGKEIRSLTGHDYTIRSLAFSGDGEYLASVTQDGAVFLWQATTGRLLARFRERGRWLGAYSLAFAPDGRTLAATDDRGTIRLWEMATRKLRLQLLSTQQRISCIAFSPDGRTLATSSPDATVLVWDVTGRRQDGKWVPARLAEKELKALWSDLAGPDAARAYRACWRLAAAPKEAVPFVQGQLDLLPVPPSPEKLAKLLADLDSARFRVRNDAFQALQKLGEAAEPALRRELKGKVSLERRQRLELLLQELASSPERLRILRTLEVLEQINTPEALQVIRRMGQGAPEAFRTQQAKSVLARRFQQQ